MENNSRRYIEYDLVKGLLIFLVVLGHTIQVGSLDLNYFYSSLATKFIYSFHMPLFIYISGLFCSISMKKKTRKEFILGRVKSLVTPTIVWGCIAFCTNKVLIVLSNGNVGFDIAELSSNIVNLWFPWSVFCLSCILVIAESQKSLVSKVIIYLASVILLGLLPNSELNLFMFPFFIWGFYSDKKLPTSNKTLFFSTFFFFILLLFYRTESYIYISGVNPWKSEFGFLNQIYIDIYRWTIGVAGILFALTIISKIKRVLINHSKIKDSIVMAGQLSLQIYFVQHIILEIFFAALYRKIVTYIQYNPAMAFQLEFDWFLAPFGAFALVLFFCQIIKIINRAQCIRKIIFVR